jgi:hypothetical protein
MSQKSQYLKKLVENKDLESVEETIYEEGVKRERPTRKSRLDQDDELPGRANIRSKRTRRPRRERKRSIREFPEDSEA